MDNVPPTVADILDVTPDPRNTAVDAVDVVFSEAIDPTTFGAGNLALSLGGTSITISVPLVFTPISATTVQVSGLAPLTGSQGTYVVTATAAGVQDLAGNVGSASSPVQDSWLMDTTAPTSSVNSLTPRQTSKSFTVSVTGSDPSPGAGITPSGVASYDIDVAVDGTSFNYWTTVPASAASAVYTGQSNHTYAFHSVARDLAGNIEAKGATVIEASTFLPDLDPPDTQVSSVRLQHIYFRCHYDRQRFGGVRAEVLRCLCPG